MKTNLLLDNENSVKYQVVLNGQVLAERPTSQLAETFVAQLTSEQQNEVSIVPVTTDSGKQILLG